MFISKTSALPLYIQIQQKIVQQIQSGKFRPGDLLYSERELTEMFSVSRMTARQAVRSLCAAGYAHSEKGKGTFVARLRAEKNIQHLTSFTEEMHRLGLRPSSKVVRCRLTTAGEAGPEVSEKLRIGANEGVLVLQRLRCANGEAMALEKSILPHRICAGLESQDLSGNSLYAILENHYRVRLGWADETVEAVLPLTEQAALLGITTRKPVLRATRVVHTIDGQPVEYVRSLYRGDRYHMVIHLSRMRRQS